MAPAAGKKRTSSSTSTAAAGANPNASSSGNGGSASDIASLSRSLGISVQAVEAMLAAQGSGIEPTTTTSSSRSSRASTLVAPAPAAPRASGSAGAGKAWSDFMTEEISAVNVNTSTNTPSSKDVPGPTAASTKDTASTSSSHAKEEDKQNPSITSSDAGVLLQTGTLDSSVAGRKDKILFTATAILRSCDLFVPTKLVPDVFSSASVKITKIATSCSACHSLCIDTNGNLYGWGRNEEAQLSSSSNNWSESTAKLSVYKPRKIDGPWSADATPLTTAAVGKSHSIVIDAKGLAYACGSNKCGQLGVGLNTDRFTTFKKCAILTNLPPSKASSNTATTNNSTTLPTSTDTIRLLQVSCGEAFTVALDQDGFLYSTGSSEYGQLGNGETGEYIEKAGKVSFANAKQFERRTLFYSNYDDDKITLLPNGNSIQLAHISCGRHHTVAVEKKTLTNTAPRVYSWGCGNFGCLGHRVQADEYAPRVVEGLTGPLFNSNYPVRAAAGTSCSLVITSSGHLYYWGKHGRSNNEATMRPTLQESLAHNGHIVKDASAGNSTVVVCTENGSTISWGVGPCGELGHGFATKSSAKPQFVESLDKCLVTTVSCGYGHTLFLVRDEDEEDHALVAKLSSVFSKELLEIEEEEEEGLQQITGNATSTKKQKKSAAGKGKKGKRN